MKFFFAPLEGITYYNFRQVHHELYPGIDEYYSPFVVATWTHKMKSREKKDILPENNVGVPLVPQILTNQADEFLFTAQYMADFGYTEVNLNAGCPVGTVTAKGKGSGLLRDPEALDRFLDGIFNGLEKERITVSSPDGKTVPLHISVKTRLGWDSPEEFDRILEVYQRYPISMLIVHARTRQELYRGEPELEAFANAYHTLNHSSSAETDGHPVTEMVRNLPELPRISNQKLSPEKNSAESDSAGRGNRIKLCYNGNIFTPEDASHIERQFPALDAIMIGRGLLQDPGLVARIQTGKDPGMGTIQKFHDVLYQRYQEQFQDDRILVNHMKEIWTYLGSSFPGSERYIKAIHKARGKAEYQSAVRILFSNYSSCR